MDKRRRNFQFKEGDHVFLRVMPMTGVGRAIKSRKFTPKFIGPYQILLRFGLIACQIALPSFFNLEERKSILSRLYGVMR
ncbi:hypothetical protein CR513_27329, partial [Mucuna pruriens]